MNLIAVVLDFGKIGRRSNFDADGLGEHLLAREHYGVLDGGVEIALHHLGRMRARGFEEVGEDAIDLIDFEAHVFHHFAGGAGGREIATDDFDDAGDPGERIANFVSKARRQFAERGEVLGP